MHVCEAECHTVQFNAGLYERCNKQVVIKDGNHKGNDQHHPGGEHIATPDSVKKNL
jgi:hypothetical protein